MSRGALRVSLSGRRGRARLGTLLIGALLAVTAAPALGPAGSWAPAHAVDEPSGEIEAAPQAVLAVAPVTPVLNEEDEQYRFEAVLRNPGDEPLPAGTVTLWLDGSRAQSYEDLSADAETREPALIAHAEAQETAAGQQQRFEFELPRLEMPQLLTREPGVYLLRAAFTPLAGALPSGPSFAGEGEEELSPQVLRAATPLVWGGIGSEPGAGPENETEAGTEAGPEAAADPETGTGLEGEAEAAPVPLTLVMPLVLPSGTDTMPNAEQLTVIAPALLEQLAAAEEHSATLAVDPRIVASIRGLGTAAPAVARTLLENLEAAPLHLFMLQFADADPAVQAALGFEELLQPLGFTHITRDGDFEPRQQIDGIEFFDPVGETPGFGVPSRARMLSLSNAVPGAWPAASAVDHATTRLLETAGLSTLVLDSSNVSEATSARVSIGDFDVLVADSGLADGARAALAGPSGVERLAGGSELVARLALAAQLDAQGAILALDRGAVADLTGVLDLIGTLDQLSWVNFVPESLQPTGTAMLRAPEPAEADSAEAQRIELLQQALERSAEVDELAPLLREPNYLHEYQRLRVLELLASRYAGPEAEADFATAAELAGQRDDELLSGVRPVATESTQLVGTSSRVPVTLRNSLPFDALVQLRAAPISAAIALPERSFEAAVPAGGSTNVLVPVHSRVSSGDSGILLEVRDAGGEERFGTSVLRLTLRTSVETIMLVALGGSAVLLFGFGIWRSVRRKRPGAVTGAAEVERTH